MTDLDSKPWKWRRVGDSDCLDSFRPFCSRWDFITASRKATCSWGPRCCNSRLLCLHRVELVNTCYLVQVDEMALFLFHLWFHDDSANISTRAEYVPFPTLGHNLFPLISFTWELFMSYWRLVKRHSVNRTMIKDIRHISTTLNNARSATVVRLIEGEWFYFHLKVIGCLINYSNCCDIKTHESLPWIIVGDILKLQSIVLEC